MHILIHVLTLNFAHYESTNMDENYPIYHNLFILVIWWKTYKLEDNLMSHFLYFFLSKLIPPISRHICKYLGFLFYLTWDTRCKIFLFKRFFVEYDFIIIWESISFLSSMRIFFIFHKTEKQKTYCYIILKYYIYLVPNM